MSVVWVLKNWAKPPLDMAGLEVVDMGPTDTKGLPMGDAGDMGMSSEVMGALLEVVVVFVAPGASLVLPQTWWTPAHMWA